MQQLHGTRETVRDSKKPRRQLETCSNSMGPERKLKREPATIRDSERHPATLGDSERHAETLRNRRDTERQPTIVGVSKRH